MQIIIDKVDFWDSFEAMKYWSHPKTYDIAKKREEAYNYIHSDLYYGSRKMDGAWNMIIRDMNGDYHMRSRTANVEGSYTDKAEWVPDIINGLNIPNGSAIIGEIYLPNNEGSRKVTSVLNCLKDKCLERQRAGGYLHFYAFDIVAWNGKSLINKEFKERIFNYLYTKFKECIKNDLIEVAEYKKGAELWTLYSDILAMGGEGIVITKETTKYLCGKRQARTTLKLKKELAQTIDCFYDGNYRPANKEYKGDKLEDWPYWVNQKTGEYSTKCMLSEYFRGETWEPVTKNYYYGWASAISISVMKDGKPYHLGYISGITDEIKEGVVKNPKEWIGRVCEINAMEIEHIDGRYSLRHGRIIAWRADKLAKDCTFDQIG